METLGGAGNNPFQSNGNIKEEPKSAGTAAAKSSLPPITDDDEDDDITLDQLTGRLPPPKAPTTPSNPPAKPASTTPKPAIAKPATTTPKSAAVTPKPATTTPKPAATTLKPAATTLKPAATTPKPAATTPKPAVATPKSAATTSKPAAVTPKPTAPKPEAATAKQAGTTPKLTAVNPPSSKPASKAPAKPNGDKIEKTVENKTDIITTPTTKKIIDTKITKVNTTTPTASSNIEIIKTLTSTTPIKHEEDSDDDKPLSALVSEKKIIKIEKKADSVVTKKTTIKKEDGKKVVETKIKKETPKGVQKTVKRTVKDSDDESEEEKPKGKKRVKAESNSDDSESDLDSDDGKKRKKKTPAQAKTTPKKKPKKEAETPDKKGNKKVQGEEQWKYWEDEPLPEGKKWLTLEHNGVMFAAPYEPHGVKFYYDGKPINLSPEAEEVATFYAKYLETDYPKKDVFNSNFWADFREYLTKEQQKAIKHFAKADFTHISKYLIAQKELKKSVTSEQKKAAKAEKDKLMEKYGFANINGHRQKISNWATEVPGLFLGRGEHPKTGKVKKRIAPEDIIINIGKKSKVPEAPPGHSWQKIQHDDEVSWLAMWKENINGAHKYVWLHATSFLKGTSDMNKFENARELKTHIEKIRKTYNKELENDSKEIRQRATALYLIDRLALRVGNEKDSSEAADTVGCCSLRVEHVTVKEPLSVTLDFLGKDSMRYHNTVDVDKRVFKNLREFTTGKKKAKDNLFDELTPTVLNKYLKEFMDKLSAKVFRTYNASLTLQKELAKMEESLMDKTVDEKVLFYNRCNREVAILCNHQKTLSKNHGESMSKMEEKVAEFEKKKDQLTKQIAFLKGKGKAPVLSDSDESDADTPKKPTPKKATPKKENKNDDDFATTKKRKKGEEEEQDDFQDTPKKKKKKRSLPDTIEKCKNQIDRCDVSISKWMIKITEKDELKSVALGTSKINYIDPRITTAWAKKVGVPLEKLFSKSLREKFPWAMDVGATWDF